MARPIPPARSSTACARLTVALLCLCCWFGLSTSSRAAEAVPAPGAPKGILYKIEKGGRTHFLFGLVHVGRKSFYPLSRQISAAIRQSDIVAVEADVLAPDTVDKFKKFGRLSGTSLQDHLQPDDWRLLLQQSERLRWAEPGSAKPAMLALGLSSLDGATAGLSADYSVDSYLLGFAGATKKRVVELEGLERQLSMFDDMDLSEQSRFLSHTLKSIVSGDNARGSERIVSDWAAGDEAALTETFAIDEGSPVHERLFARRNKLFADALVKLSEEGSWFAGVGTGHLFGSTGLLQLLSGQGFKCTRVS